MIDLVIMAESTLLTSTRYVPPSHDEEVGREFEFRRRRSRSQEWGWGLGTERMGELNGRGKSASARNHCRRMYVPVHFFLSFPYISRPTSIPSPYQRRQQQKQQLSQQPRSPNDDTSRQRTMASRGFDDGDDAQPFKSSGSKSKCQQDEHEHETHPLSKRSINASGMRSGW